MEYIYLNLVDIMPKEVFCGSLHQLLEIILLKANLNLEFQYVATISCLIFSSFQSLVIINSHNFN